jgi:hypothetical protein
MNNTTNPNRLRVACLRSLERYFFEANRTCKLLIAVKKFPASHRERLAIREQRMVETAALQDYLSARARLMEAAYCDGFSSVPLGGHTSKLRSNEKLSV